jgi:hypothetical protein
LGMSGVRLAMRLIYRKNDTAREGARARLELDRRIGPDQPCQR